MATWWLIEISPSDQKLEELRRLGMVAVETTSWRYSSRSVSGLLSLLKEAGAIADTQEEPQIIVLVPPETGEPNGQKIQDIEKYFHELTRKSLDRLGIQSSLDVDLPDVLAFNLMPFYPRAAIADRAINGICRAIEDAPQLSSTCLTFFVRTHRLFSDNNELRRLVQSDLYPNRAIIIDLDGFSITLERNRVKRSNKPRVTKKHIARSTFEKILHFKDKRSFRRALVYQTNINIGHFNVGSCHVRTHYDLNDFVRRDNVFEHIYSEISRFTNGLNNITLIATGLERNALTILGNRLQSASMNDPQITSSGGLQRRVVTWQGHFSADEIDSHTEQVRNWLRRSDCVLVLTDIVNSGSTVRKVEAALKKIWKDMEAYGETADNSIEIETFAIAKMNNSPPDIEAAVTINRPYFQRKRALCPLCQLGQPIKKVRQDTWEEDFRHVDPAQLTPLDFWEMVQDCDALQREEPYVGDIRLMHRVDTKKLMERYGHWLANVIAAKYMLRWGKNYPDVILTVSEESGLNFSAIVRKALRPYRCRILDVPRPVLDEAQNPSDQLDSELRKCQELGLQFLLVDDGINLGGTARKLIRFIKRYEVRVLGMIVLDSRLEEPELQKLEADIEDGSFRVEALYIWPSRPVVAGERVSV